jgi:hypothetical protein
MSLLSGPSFVVEHVNNRVHGDHIVLPMQDPNMQRLPCKRKYNHYVLDSVDPALCYRMGIIPENLL